MNQARFNIQLIHALRDILLRLHDGESPEDVQNDFHQHFKDVNASEILLIAYELKSGEEGFTSRDIMKLFAAYEHIFGHSIHEIHVPDRHPGHPIHVFKEENRALELVINEMNNLVEAIEENEAYLQEEKMVKRLKEKIARLGQFINHYHRKEKLFFPILERYGHFTLTRIMWGDDDRIRNFYRGTKSMMEKILELDFKYIKQTYDLFERNFKEMMFEEEVFLLPVLHSIFTDEDWLAIARESDAYGYALIEPEDKWRTSQEKSVEEPEEQTDRIAKFDGKDLPFGGGFLTINEANHILNNLPVEITFVDKYGVFKYFNDKVKASEMMFVRTPSSIGRNVVHCHPPSSMSKVMQLIRDLHTGRRSSECMWFKKDGRYVHITYKGLFDENGEYLGILEYVQDIQPFLDLPREVKKELSRVE